MFQVPIQGETFLIYIYMILDNMIRYKHSIYHVNVHIYIYIRINYNRHIPDHTTLRSLCLGGFLGPEFKRSGYKGERQTELAKLDQAWEGFARLDSLKNRPPVGSYYLDAHGT